MEIFLKRRPVFVIGTGRCGTTLLTDLIQGEKIHCLKERQVPSRFKEFGNKHIFNMVYREEIDDELFIRYFNAIRVEILKKYNSDEIYCEKIPHGQWAIHLIKMVFPQAKFIEIFREGMDTVQSMLNAGWYAPTDTWPRWIPQGDLRNWVIMDQFEKCCIRLANTIRFTVDNMITYSESGQDYLAISYEELMENTETVLKLLESFTEAKFYRGRVQIKPSIRNWDNWSNESKYKYYNILGEIGIRDQLFLGYKDTRDMCIENREDQAKEISVVSHEKNNNKIMKGLVTDNFIDQMKRSQAEKETLNKLNKIIHNEQEKLIHPNKKDKINIFMLVKNRKEFTDLSLKFLFRFTDFNLVNKLIIINDSSDNETINSCLLHIRKAGTGEIVNVNGGSVTNALFFGTKQYLQDEVKYMVKLDNDMIVSENWLNILYTQAEKNYNYYDIFGFTTVNEFFKSTFSEIWSKMPPEEYSLRPVPYTGGNFLMKWEVFKRYRNIGVIKNPSHYICGSLSEVHKLLGEKNLVKIAIVYPHLPVFKLDKVADKEYDEYKFFDKRKIDKKMIYRLIEKYYHEGLCRKRLIDGRIINDHTKSKNAMIGILKDSTMKNKLSHTEEISIERDKKVEPDNKAEKIICISGMHRSGTSMITKLLIECGLYTGPKHKLIPPQPDNPMGFWENIDFVSLNDAILFRLGGGWDFFPINIKPNWEKNHLFDKLKIKARELAELFKNFNLCGWKDPRSSLTISFWKDVFPELRVVLCLRNPLDVALSLQKRNNSSIPFGLNLWEKYNRQLISNVDFDRLVITHYDSYFNDAKQEIQRMADKLAIGTTQEIINKASSTITNTLRHTHHSKKDLMALGIPTKYIELYDYLCDLAGPIFRECKSVNSITNKNYKSKLHVTSIIILVHNQLKYTKKCIESIVKYTGCSFELIVIDNGSTDGTKQYLEEMSINLKNNFFQESMKNKDNRVKGSSVKQSLNKSCRRFKVISNLQNIGFAAGNNQGIEVAQGEYVLLMNNDVVVTPGWLERLIECAENHPKAGIIGPRSNYVSGPQLVTEVEYNTVNLDGLEAFAKKFATKNYRKSSRIIRVVGFCMLIKKQVIEKIGGLDSRYGLGNFEDDDFSLRAAISGFESWVAEDCFIHHYGSRTFAGANIDYKESLEKNWEVFKEKWGLTKDTAYGSPYSISQMNISSFNPRYHYIPFSVNEDELFKKQIVNSSGEEPVENNNLLENAIRLFQKGLFEKGIEVFLSGIHRFPADHRVYMSFAEQLINCGRYQDALDVLKEMPNESGVYKKTSESQNADIALLEGYCQEGLENYEVASKIAAQVLKNQPDHPKALNLRGLVAYRKNQKDLSEDSFLRAIEIDPDYGEAYTNLGSLRWESQDTSEALRLFEQGFALTPTDLEIAAAYHEAFSELNEFKRAEPIVRKALERFPYSKKIHYILIDVLIKLGKTNESMAQIENAIAICGIENGLIEAALNIRAHIGHAEIKLRRKMRASVSLCMIVKNEEKFLAQCLASVKPIVDEMIIVDTGSTDRTRNVAIIFGARVFDFEWDNDFAAARNFSISKAKGDWIFIMDADEVISPQDHGSFRKLTRKNQTGIIAYSIVTRNYCHKANTIGWNQNDGKYVCEEAGIGWIPSEKVRLFRNSKGIMFEGAVHEMVDPVLKRLSIKVKKSNIPVHHYGSLNKGNLDYKGQLYFNIGKKKLKQNGNDINAVRELAIQATVLKKGAEAIDLWQKFLSMKPEKRSVSEAYVNMVSAYIQMRDYANALIFARKAVKIYPKSKEVQLNLGLAELYNGNADAALNILETLIKRHPDFPPAQFLSRVSKCLKGEAVDMKCSMKELKRNFHGSILTYSISELAEGLLAADQYKLATNLLQNAIGEEIVSKGIINLYVACIEKIKDSKRLDDKIPEDTGAQTESIAPLS